MLTTADAGALYKVAWCNTWNSARSRDADVFVSIHLTEIGTRSGKTLCGRKFPVEKGHPSTARMCKKCWAMAQQRGVTVEQRRTMPWVR